MTTVAYHRGVMAADSRSTANTHISNTKKLYESDEWVFGAAGNLSDGIRVWEWLRDGRNEKKRPDVKKFEALVWSRKERKLYSLDDDLVLLPITDKHAAIGSGMDLARAAMHLGESAREAVEVASKYDAMTGGKIVTINVRGK